MVINKIVFTSPEAMVEFSGGKKLKLSIGARQKPLTSVNLYSLKGQGMFSLDVNKIIQLQVTLQPR